MSITDTRESQRTSFRSEATEVLGQLRHGFAEILAEMSAPITKAADLRRALKLDQKLCGKVFKVATCLDPLDAGPHVPGPANMRMFFKAVAKQGISTELLDEVSQAVDAFDRLVITHAEDRATFDSMIGSIIADENLDQISLQHRRAAFRAQRHIWGVHAKTQFMTHVIQPSADESWVDIAMFEGCIDLRRVRYNAPLLISRIGMVDDSGEAQDIPREPLDPQDQLPHGIGLLRDFCSQPLPEFRTVKSEGGLLRCELVADGVGNKSAITCVEGHVSRPAAPRYSQRAGDEISSLGVSVEIPCEVLVLDVLVKEGTAGEFKPVADVLLHPPGWGALPRVSPPKELYHLPQHVPVAYLGKGPMTLRNPDVPRYTEMANYAFGRLGWNIDDFLAYRCRVEYPVLPSLLAINFKLLRSP